MTRYILIDNCSGYIWGDSADLDGQIFTGTPLEYTAALDAHLGEHDRTYKEVDNLASNETGYRVYSADVSFPVVTDGQDQEMIDVVERDCQFITLIKCSTRTALEEALCDEFQTWCDAQGLPEMSADELLYNDITSEQRSYISDFIHRWDAAVYGA